MEKEGLRCAYLASKSSIDSSIDSCLFGHHFKLVAPPCLNCSTNIDCFTSSQASICKLFIWLCDIQQKPSHMQTLVHSADFLHRQKSISVQIPPELILLMEHWPQESLIHNMALILQIKPVLAKCMANSLQPHPPAIRIMER